MQRLVLDIQDYNWGKVRTMMLSGDHINFQSVQIIALIPTSKSY